MRKAVAAVVCMVIGVTGCATGGGADGKRTRTDTETGAIVGAVGGAIVGSAVGKKRGKGALLGAVGGGLAGAAVGNYMDRQKQDLEKALKAERDAGAINIQTLPGDVIKVTMTAQTAFESGSADIKPGFSPTMDKLADIVVRYGKTALTVVGHTDSQGTDQYNQELSERRAKAVIDYLAGKNVHQERLSAMGKGEAQPIADNDSDAGRRANRRVEVLVEPVRAS